MSKILEMKARRAELSAAVGALATLEASGTTLSAEQLASIDAMQKEFDELGAKLNRAEAAERMAASTATQVETLNFQGSPPAGGAVPVYAQPAAPKAKGGGLARMATALAAAEGDRTRAVAIANARGYGADVAAALNINDAAGGGVLVPQAFSTELIELLRPQSVVRSLGTRSLPLINGSMSMPRIKNGAVVGYAGSDTDTPATGMQFEDLKLTAKNLVGLVPISNDLIAFSGVSEAVDSVVVNDLTTAVALREDKAFLRDDGTNNTPKGLLNWAIPAAKMVASDGVTLQKVETDLGKALLFLRNANSNFVSAGWVMSPRTYTFLESLRDGNGNKVYPELERKQLKGYPARITTQIPDNLGVGGDESEIYLADFGDCFIAETGQIAIAFSKEAAYQDAGGNMVSAFARNQTLVRIIAQHDFGPRHQENIAILTAVKWGK